MARMGTRFFCVLNWNNQVMTSVVAVPSRRACDLLLSRLGKDTTHRVKRKFEEVYGGNADRSKAPVLHRLFDEVDLECTSEMSLPATVEEGADLLTMDDVLTEYVAAMELAGWTDTEVDIARVEMQQALLGGLGPRGAIIAAMGSPVAQATGVSLGPQAASGGGEADAADGASWRDQYKRPSTRAVVVVVGHDVVASFTDEDLYRMSWGALARATDEW
jgi:hypothetical protein